jgi:glycosyltransferase involved in cell wall biosynthesis
MTFSLIVPSYKRPGDLRRCVRAVLAGRRLPEELIVVVRDTDMESQAAVSELAGEANGEVIRRVLVTPAGQIAAISAGLEAATGEVIAFTDDDTEPTPAWLERIAAAYADAAVAGVGGRDRLPNHPDEGPAERVGLLTWYGGLIGNHHRGCRGIRRVHHLKGANMSFRRAALPAFDPNLFRAASALNDTDASLGAGRHGILLYDPEAIVDHYATERGAGVPRDFDDPDIVRADSHNWVYCILKHLPWWAKPSFVGYALVIGQGSRLGPVRWLWLRLTGRPRSLRQLWAATVGKLEGLRTYVSRPRRAPPRATREAAHVS